MKKHQWTLKLTTLIMVGSLALMAMGCGQAAPTAPSFEMQGVKDVPVVPGGEGHTPEWQ